MLVLIQLALNIEAINKKLAGADATHIVNWAVASFEDGLVMSTSFGIQSAVMLHLATQSVPNIPVVWVDTGYLPTQTYRFAHELSERLKLNLNVYQSPVTPARMEALHGKLWALNDIESLNRYDQMRKVEPMRRALRDLQATAWLAGLRSAQTTHRKTLNFVSQQFDRYKVLPILRWTSRDVYEYLKAHDLPYHPLFNEGYTTVGDWHSSRPLTLGDKCERDTRFRGLKQECGLHLPHTRGDAESVNSSVP